MQEDSEASWALAVVAICVQCVISTLENPWNQFRNR